MCSKIYRRALYEKIISLILSLAIIITSIIPAFATQPEAKIRGGIAGEIIYEDKKE